MPDTCWHLSLYILAMWGVFVGGPWVWLGVYMLGAGILLDALISKRDNGRGS